VSAAEPLPRSHSDYRPIRDYAAIGDGRTVALVERSGSVDWLCLPDLDSASVFAALLDRERGGFFVLRPTAPFKAERRYLDRSNVLETTYTTAAGRARVVEALTLAGDGLEPGRELVRRIEGLSGEVEFELALQPRFDYGRRRPRLLVQDGSGYALDRSDALVLLAWADAQLAVEGDAITGTITLTTGERAQIVLASAHGEPLVLPSRDEVERRLALTDEHWRSWAEARSYRGPWRQEVLRSVLALRLLVHSPTGAVAAAPTTSLPEQIGGERNWDYRFSWVRDSALTIDAFLAVGCAAEARSFFWWLLHASQISRPRLHVLYRLNGGTRAEERTLPLTGYRDSSPVRIGNGALEQLQLDLYGNLLQSAWLFARSGNRIDRETGKRLAATADHVTEIWRREDAGIWEVRSKPLNFTQSKMMCWLALRRALDLAEQGALPDRHASRWRDELARIGEFIESRCWSEHKRSYARFAEGEELDASVLLALIFGYGGDRERVASTVEAIRRELATGPYVRRYSGDDGLSGDEGAFLACSFWLVEALARVGRRDEAAALLNELLALANDVGLYAEEIDPETSEFLGNFPQGLSHIGLIRAAAALAEEPQR
jgi:GH15 family glucan-1,4-alpha-glucosidase